MIKYKVAVSILIFSSLFAGAWMANGKWTHFNQLPWSIPKGDVRILHTEDKGDKEQFEGGKVVHDENEDFHDIIHIPYKPREYIRIMKSRE